VGFYQKIFKISMVWNDDGLAIALDGSLAAGHCCGLSFRRRLRQGIGGRLQTGPGAVGGVSGRGVGGALRSVASTLRSVAGGVVHGGALRSVVGVAHGGSGGRRSSNGSGSGDRGGSGPHDGGTTLTALAVDGSPEGDRGKKVIFGGGR
jgi:hypothetical protein